MVILDKHALNWKKHRKCASWKRVGYFYHRKSLISCWRGIAHCLPSCLCATFLAC